MAMNVKSEGASSDPSPVAEINVTPLVDVMLVLLIIFMVTMPLMMSQLTITIPKPSRNPPPVDKPKAPILVYVVQGGTGMELSTKFGERCAVDPGQVEDTIVRLRPDISKASELITVSGQKLVSYGRVVGTVERLGLKGFEKITLKEELDPSDPDPEVQRLLASAPPVASTVCTPGEAA